MAKNLSWEQSKVTAEERFEVLGQRGGVVWFTGFSGSGKSTLAGFLEKRLFQAGYGAFILDGDNLRHKLNSDLGFSPEDRAENIRRVGEVAALFANSGMITICAFISPYEEDRLLAKAATGEEKFIEIYLNTSIEVCEERDPKGLYKKARSGEIDEFTGISAPYESPKNPALTINTNEVEPAEAVEQILAVLVERQFIRNSQKNPNRI